MDTIFDKILQKKIPADVVFENEAVMAFKDLHPHAKVHVLVIPKKKQTRFSDLKNTDVNEVGIFFKNVSQVAAHLGLDEGGYRIILNCGPNGGQTVEYLHAHIMGGEKLGMMTK